MRGDVPARALPRREFSVACEVRNHRRGSRYARVVLRTALRILRSFEHCELIPENPICRFVFYRSSLAIRELCQVLDPGPLRFLIEKALKERGCYFPSSERRHEARCIPSRERRLSYRSARLWPASVEIRRRAAILREQGYTCSGSGTLVPREPVTRATSIG